MSTAEFWLRRSPTQGAGVVAVVPHDTAPIVAGGVAVGFRVGTGGTVAFKCPDGTEGSITAGDKEYVPVPVTHIKATGTGASGILAIV